MKKKLQTVGEAMREVFRRPHNIGVALLTGFAVIFIAVWLSNRQLLGFVLFSGTFSLKAKIAILIKSLGGIMTNFSSMSRFVTVSIAILFGINTAMTAHYLRARIAMEKSMGVGFFGAAVGMFGIGCASCGSALLTVLFGTAFTASVIGILPFKGLEFGLLGIATLLLSLYLTSKKVVAPLVCDVSKKSP